MPSASTSDAAAGERLVRVPPERLERWFANFQGRHGAVDLRVDAGALTARAEDGATASATLPFQREYAGLADPAALAAAASAVVGPGTMWGVLLVRKGGFAVARLTGLETSESKVGQRHVQGRSKAGGQSQQRFARRRGNQARQAYEAAAEHARRILVGGRPLHALVCGGDRAAVEAVLSEPRLATVASVRTGPWLPVPDPRRGVLEQAVLDATALEVRVSDPA